MALFLTLDEAKAHLSIPLTTTDRDAFVQLKLDQAEASIIEHCNSTAYWRGITPTWAAGTVPPSIQAAVLVLLTHFAEHRGDDMVNVGPALWQEIDRRIGPNRDPVIA